MSTMNNDSEKEKEASQALKRDASPSPKRQKQQHEYGWDKKWTKETESMRLFDFISNGEVKDKLGSFLKENDAETLGKLSGKMKNITFWLTVGRLGKGYVDENLTSKLEKFLNQRKDLVSILNDQFLNTREPGLPKHNVQTKFFADDLARTRSARSTAKERDESYVPIIVSGSSGSGKTTFAGCILRQEIIYQNAAAGWSSFCVYMTGRDATESNKAVDANAMTKATVTCIRNLIENFAADLDCELSLPIKNIEMVVIIDELDIEDDEKYVDTADKLTRLTTVLQEKIANSVQLVLVGTGLDFIKTRVNRRTEAVKVRVKPWTSSNVLQLAETLNLTSDDVQDVLREQPIFNDLGTNARAAKFLVESLNKYKDAFSTTSSVLVDTVVQDVAFRYISSNRLSKCNIEERRHVAKVVLSTLQKVRRGEATYPSVDCKDPKVRRVSFSLMDFHVETTGSNLELSKNERYAVTVSPAITVVLSALMGALETFSPTWEGLERVGTLLALRDLFVESAVPVPAMSIVLSDCPFPAPGAKFVEVPNLKKHAVLRNGRGAPFADIVSFYQLYQFQRVKDPSKPTPLKIHDEMSKMGILQTSSYVEGKESKKHLPSRLLLQYLIEQWKKLGTFNDDKNSSAITHAESKRQTSTVDDNNSADAKEQNQCTLNKGKTRRMYPFNQLHLSPDLGELVFQEKPMNADDLKDLRDILPEGKKIAVVFATNATRFVIDGAAGASIERQHVDDKGNLLREQGEALKFLWPDLDQDSIDLRFHMCDP